MKLLYALRFLTAIPLPWRPGEDLAKAAGSAALFPLVGLLLGAGLAAVRIAVAGHWSPFPAAVVIVLLWTAATGALHLDGVADTADGILGARERARRLEIMKDPRSGAFGVTAVVCLLLLKTALLVEAAAWQPVFAAPIVARWAIVLYMALFPAAKKEGLSAFFKDHMRTRHVIIALLLAAAPLVVLFSWTGIVLLAAVSAAALVPALIVGRTLGGHTGDTVGALCEMTESLVLLAFALVPVDLWSGPLSAGLVHL